MLIICDALMQERSILKETMIWVGVDDEAVGEVALIRVFVIRNNIFRRVRRKIHIISID